MYRQCSCLYRYSAYIFNIGAYSDPYSSIGATLIYTYAVHTCTQVLDILLISLFICVLSTVTEMLVNVLNLKGDEDDDDMDLEDQDDDKQGISTYTV